MSEGQGQNRRGSERRLDPASLEAFAVAALCACGVRKDVAEPVARGLTQASLRGVDSHGLRLLPHYLRATRAGRINGDPDLRFERRAAAAGLLDADHTFGHAAGRAAMGRALELAAEAGLGAVAVRHSSHFGAAAFYALEAAEAGFLGLCTTHADALLLPPGGTRPFLGTNPIAFCAPVEGEGPLCLDTATSRVTWNRLLERRERGLPLEPGWAVDAEGGATRDAELAAALLPIGDYKGFGLAMMVEVLCSLLTGMPWGRDLTRMYADPIERRRHLGHFFLAIDVARFEDPARFRRRMRALLEELRAEPARGGGRAPRAPGDPEKACERERRARGIPVPARLWAELLAIAADCDLAPPGL
jgi:LDH2 family malate/lactate/ureidoglycolate dehydrogenase